MYRKFYADHSKGLSRVLGSGICLNYSAGLKKNAKFLDEIQDLTATLEAVFTKILAWDTALGKKLYFGIEMIEVRDVGPS